MLSIVLKAKISSMSELLPYPSIRLTSFFKYLCQSLLIPFQNPCSVTQCWSWSISLCPSSSRMCRGLSNGMCCPLTTIWLDCTVSVEKSVPLFLQTYPYLMNFSIRVSLRDTDCSNCLRRFSAVTARFL